MHQVFLISAAILQQDDRVVLVLQQGKDDPEALWALPGGRVESGETFIEGLRREVIEETGLVIENPDHLIASAHILTPHHVTIAKTFLVTRWTGELAINDPDDVVKDVRFFPLEQACKELRLLPWLPMWQPAVFYFEQKIISKHWTFKNNAQGKLTLDSFI